MCKSWLMKMRTILKNIAPPSLIKFCIRSSGTPTSTFEMIDICLAFFIHPPLPNQQHQSVFLLTVSLTFPTCYFKICRFDSHLDIIKEKLLLKCLASTTNSPKSKRLPRILPTLKRQGLRGGSRRPSFQLKKRLSESILL